MTIIYPKQKGIDLNSAVARVGGKTALLNKLLHSFLSKYLNASTDIQTLLSEDQAEGARRLSHQIKGAAANLGANDVFSNAQTIEAQLKDGRTDISAHLLEEFATNLNTLASYVEKHCPSPPAV